MVRNWKIDAIIGALGYEHRPLTAIEIAAKIPGMGPRTAQNYIRSNLEGKYIQKRHAINPSEHAGQIYELNGWGQAYFEEMKP